MGYLGLKSNQKAQAAEMGLASSSTAQHPLDFVYLTPTTKTDTSQTPNTMGLVGKEEKCDTAISHLRNSNGDSIFLVGTAHISNNSASLVSRVFDGVSPDLIMVELDKKRLNVVTEDDESAAATAAKVVNDGGNDADNANNADADASAKGSTNSNINKKTNNNNQESPRWVSKLQSKFEGIKKALAHPKQAILSALIGRVITKMYQGIDQEGIPVGGEFVAAFKYASSKGIPVLLGDRPIDVTFDRLGQAASAQDLTKILTPDEDDAKELGILFGADEQDIGSAQDLAMQVEVLKNRETVSLLQGYIAKKSPELYNALIGERDQYMAESLAGAIGKKYNRIVGVVGFAHLNGIEKQLQQSGFKLVDMCSP